MKLAKKVFATMVATVLVGTTMMGVMMTPVQAQTNSTGVTKSASTDVKQYQKPKYVFTFIGDGMSYVQLNAAQIYKGVTEKGGVQLSDIAVTEFPVVGSATTYDSTSFCPDSASTATSISSGFKTHSGVIGYQADKQTKGVNIAEMLKAEGYKVGIVSSVSIDHATPAAFYAHEVSRSNMYGIALQLAESGFDYFAGGALAQPTGKDKDQKDAYTIIEENGYTIADTKEEIASLNSESGKVYAINPTLRESSAMNYDLDAAEDELRLKDLVEKGIEVLDNDEGFFMMVEGGKIDWAGHANDARANIQDVLALNEAIQVAIDFYNAHPDETLIIVTGDHETGGMTIGQATTGYDTAFNLLSNQTMSYVAFDELIAEYKKTTTAEQAKIEDVLPMIEENFGLVSPANAAKAKDAALVMSDYEYKKLENAFEQTMKAKADRNKDIDSEILYGGYEPLTVTLTHILNNKAGIGWTSYSHTGVPVPVYAMGQGEDVFSGSYDNTDIFHKLVEVLGLK